MQCRDLFQLIRVNQWYKNLVVFLALIFSGNLFNPHLFTATILGFVAVSFVASAGYIINDIVDSKHDLFHPEKRNRPIASGRIGTSTAGALSLIFLVAGVIIGLFLSFHLLLLNL